MNILYTGLNMRPEYYMLSSFFYYERASPVNNQKPSVSGVTCDFNNFQNGLKMDDLSRFVFRRLISQS